MSFRNALDELEPYGPSVEVPEQPGSEATYSGRREDLVAAIARLQATVDAERAS